MVAFIGNPNRDFSSVAFNIYTVKNNRTKVHTKNLSASPENLFWLSKTKLAFEVDERGSANIKILVIIQPPQFLILILSQSDLLLSF